MVTTRATETVTEGLWPRSAPSSKGTAVGPVTKGTLTKGRVNKEASVTAVPEGVRRLSGLRTQGQPKISQTYFGKRPSPVEGIRSHADINTAKHSEANQGSEPYIRDTGYLSDNTDYRV